MLLYCPCTNSTVKPSSVARSPQTAFDNQEYSINKTVITIAALATLLSAPSFAGCKDDIKATRQMIDKDKDKYTLEARNKAKADLLVAETKLLDLNPLPDLDCQKMVREAKAELRKGKK